LVMEGKADISYGFHGRIGRWNDNLKIFYDQYNIVAKFLGTDIMIGPHGDYFYWLFSFGIIGISIYLYFLFKLYFRIREIIKSLKDNNFFYYYSRGCLTGFFVWIIMAVATNPSMIPDYGYFIMGNIGILIFYFRRKVIRGYKT
jgi:O-antigen ligase